jgi:glucosamine--fructose-6-phosphate aminotransferase (isomerizing)
MCGIFGIISKKESSYSTDFLQNTLTSLAKLSESRGKDSSGLCMIENDTVNIFKGPIKISQLTKKNDVKQSITKSLNSNNTVNYIFGHARLVTNGSQLNDDNNQPVIKDGIVCVHNGIVVNYADLWKKNPSLKREFEIDTEILPALVRNYIVQGESVESAIAKTIKPIWGTVSTAFIFNDIQKLLIATNNGSLYTLTNKKNDLLIFASERFMLSELAKQLDLEKIIGSITIHQVKPNSGITINLNEFEIHPFDFEVANSTQPETIVSKKQIKVKTFKSNKKQKSTVLDINEIHLTPIAESEKKILIYPIDKIKELKRCTKCILPHTFPFIHFDKKGVCNYCKNYKIKNQPKPIDELIKMVEPYKKKDGSPDVLIPFSGGRDSTYVLHVVKKILGLNPIAFTYDWGMVTDLARRNIASICGKLGVENIIVAADIHWKRENIRKNISAWLKKPDLGMIPLFMAGDKFFFYYAHKIKKQTNIDLNIWGINDLENTDFKTGFAGIAPKFDKKRIYSLSVKNQAKLFGFVGKNLLMSPSYINQSIFDSIGSFASRYISKKTDYYHLFDYMHWDEKEIEDTIINKYNWETSIDSSTSWRIGDGTASFYNYIYTLVAGFSENDTFRSNQVREEMITREKALELAFKENIPRYNSIKWYLEIVGLDFNSTIETINKIPRRY